MKTFKRLLKEIRVVQGRFVGAIFFIIVNMVIAQILPLILQSIIDDDLTPAIHQLEHFQLHSVYVKASLYVVLLLLGSGIAYFSFIAVRNCVTEITLSLQEQLYARMQSLPISYFDDKPAGKISTRIVNYTVNLADQFYNTLIYQFLVQALQFIIVFLILIYYNLTIGLVTLLVFPILYLWQKFYINLVKKPIEEYHEKEGEINSRVHETMHASHIIQIYNYEQVWQEEFLNLNNQMNATSQKLIRIDSYLNWSMADTLKRFFVIVFVAVLLYQFLSGYEGVTAGFVFLSVTYVERVFFAIANMVRNVPGLRRALTTADKMYEILDAEPETDGTQILRLKQGHVVFENVSFSYVEGTPVLKNISFEAAPGQTIALVGHTGSGKSSIMNLLFRFYDPQEGHIFIDHQDISECQRESVRERMGIVLQDPYLFTGTIASNIRMENENISDEAIESYLKQVGAGFMLERYPEGIYTKVLEKGKDFSTGERQLITFARTLAANPRILILDEATANIDTETEEIIQKALKVLKAGRTTFIIAHRLSTIQEADKIVVLKSGQILEEGTHEELMNKKAYYAQLYAAQYAQI